MASAMMQSSLLVVVINSQACASCAAPAVYKSKRAFDNQYNLNIKSRGGRGGGQAGEREGGRGLVGRHTQKSSCQTHAAQ